MFDQFHRTNVAETGRLRPLDPKAFGESDGRAPDGEEPR